MTLKKLGLLLSVLMIAGLFSGAAHAQDICGEATTQTLYMGKNVDVGTVSIWNDAATLFVMYRITSEEWDLDELHLAIGTQLWQIPQKKSKPIPGKFPYKKDFDEDGVKEYIFEIPLGSWTSGANLVVAAHAQLKQFVDGEFEDYYIYESAWAEGNRFSRKGWAMWFNYMVQSCNLD